MFFYFKFQFTSIEETFGSGFKNTYRIKVPVKTTLFRGIIFSQWQDIQVSTNIIPKFIRVNNNYHNWLKKLK